MRRISIPAGQCTLVFRRRFSSLPQEIEFTAESDGVVSGKVERVGSRWILGRTQQTFALAAHNIVHKGYWDTFFEVFVTPDPAVTISIARPHLVRRLLITTLVLAVIVTAVVFALTRG
jgi:hypothetical protein